MLLASMNEEPSEEQGKDFSSRSHRLKKSMKVRRSVICLEM